MQIDSAPGTKVYYTLDGSEPTYDSDVYMEPIYVYDKSNEPNVFLQEQRTVLNYNESEFTSDIVDKAFLIRAVAVDENGYASRTYTASYYIDKEKYLCYPVVSIVADPDELYGEDGIFVTGKEYDEWYLNGMVGDAPLANFLGTGKGYEIKANFEFFDNGLLLNQDIGLRIAGGSTREGRIKKLNLFARKEYSNTNVFMYNLFGNVEDNKLGIGGDYANAIVMKLAEGRDVTTQGRLRAYIFVNGEFYCETDLVEKYNEFFISQHYGLNESDVRLVEEEEFVSPEQIYDEELEKLYDFISESDFSDEETYEELCEMIDIQSYIDYMCIRTYIDDMDFTEDKNFYLWKSMRVADKPYYDGKWRWVLQDLDAMSWNDYMDYGVDSKAEKNTFELIPKYTGGTNVYERLFFTSLYKNEKFREQYVNTFLDLVNTIFDYENVCNVLKEYGEPSQIYDSANEIDFYYDFFKNRKEYIVPYMAEKFGLKGTLENVTLKVNNPDFGQVKINSAILDANKGEWTGKYYTDYKVKLQAIEKEGYTFVGWSGDVESDEKIIELDVKKGGVTVEAIFEKN